ncbi:MAG TPA: c-type cytochrome [Blastocatellia bacterium]|nr:c-type cytochrome [Blastocatellia bacterium]
MPLSKVIDIILVISLSTLVLCACKREERGFRVSPPQAERVNTIQLSEIRPGQASPQAPTKNEYEENAYAVSEGKTLFEAFNCAGCHGHGGGGSGPALMDDKWIYGSQPEQIFATIVQGRPNGMPSFRGRIPDHQVWQLVAYVRSMSRQVPKDVAPGRDDHLNPAPPELTRPRQTPKNSSLPKSGEIPQ